MSRCIPDEFFINGSVANVMKKRQKGGLKIPLRKSFAVVYCRADGIPKGNDTLYLLF